MRLYHLLILLLPMLLACTENAPAAPIAVNPAEQSPIELLETALVDQDIDAYMGLLSEASREAMEQVPDLESTIFSDRVTGIIVESEEERDGKLIYAVYTSYADGVREPGFFVFVREGDAWRLDMEESVKMMFGPLFEEPQADLRVVGERSVFAGRKTCQINSGFVCQELYTTEQGVFVDVRNRVGWDLENVEVSVAGSCEALTLIEEWPLDEVATIALCEEPANGVDVTLDVTYFRVGNTLDYRTAGLVRYPIS